MKIALCQINPIIGDFDYNSSLIMEAVDKAKTERSSLAIFPELSLLGYPPKDLLEKPAFIDENLNRLEHLAAKIQGIQVLCGFVDKNTQKTGKPLINSAAWIKDGHMTGKGGKRLLPAYDVFDESRYFEPAQESLVLELEGKRLGVTICEDTWNFGDFEGIPFYEKNPVSDLMDRHVDILINMSASPYTLGKALLRMNMLKNISSQYKVPTVYCNQVGGNDDLLFDGLSMVVDNKARPILVGKEFEPDLLIWNTEQEYDVLDDSWWTEDTSLLKGLAMGTRDYTLKCGFKKALVGLSGGIDSSLVAVIARMALGAENVTGVSMPSSFTSDISREDARALAVNLGIHFKEIPINDIYQSYKSSLAPSFSGLEEDVTEENIQARIRGNLLMALSNKFKVLLLTTGNKSEMATGYCTLYGDMNGGLAVISDVPKTMCYRLARHINRDREIIPDRILTRPPSAELKPDQTDQDTLPPYDTLDDILEAAVEKNLPFGDIVALGHEPDVVRYVLKRMVFSEYKRRQAPPGLKVTTKAFGYGRRYPIARGKQIF
ncbi:MAG: NAD+ synthase [Deltaproteobacteria bacterium]|nr:NAD+ synthase [Deltaproteobacteria bacterium]